MVEKGEMQSFQYLRDLERGEHFTYLQVRDYYIKEIKMDKTTKQNGMIKVMIEAYEGKKGRGNSTLYQALLESRGNSTLYIKEKWEKELGIDMTEEEWYNVCRVQHSTTGSRGYGGDLSGRT